MLTAANHRKIQDKSIQPEMVKAGLCAPRRRRWEPERWTWLVLLVSPMLWPPMGLPHVPWGTEIKGRAQPTVESIMFANRCGYFTGDDAADSGIVACRRYSCIYLYADG